MIDLHIHSHYSDGTWSPEEILVNAAKRGLTTISITDHDNIDGLDEALEFGPEFGIEVIPGIEITSYHRKIETHLLGYFIDYKDPKFRAIIDDLFAYRNSAIAETVALLNKKGYNISMDDVFGTSSSDYIGRPHIARALCNCGVIEHIQDAFREDLIGNDAECFLPLSNLNLEDAIDIIQNADGIPVIAHPGAWPNSGNCFPELDIRHLQEIGLEGLECAHPRHSVKHRRHFENIADSLNLIKTGGSDCHGEYYDPVKMGSVTIPAKWLQELKSRIKTGGRT